MKPCVYIDASFLEYFGELEQSQNDRKVRKGINLIDDFLFLNGEFDVFLDPGDSLANHKINEFIRIRGGRITENRGDGHFEVKKGNEFEDEILKIGSQSQFSIVFQGNVNNKLETHVERSGFYYLSAKNLDGFLSIPFIAGKSAYGVNASGDIQSWDDFKKLSHNFNTVIILDRYIFVRDPKATRSKYKETIMGIVLNLLEKNKSEKIEVLVVSVRNNKDVGSSLKEIKDQFEREFKEKRPNKEIEVSIMRSIRTTDANHDRLIITNFCAFESGESLNYFEDRKSNPKKPTINTTLKVYPFMDFENWSPFFSVLRSRKKEFPTKEDERIPNMELRAGDCDIQFIKMI